MNPVPYYQVIEFLDWLAQEGRQSGEHDSAYFHEMAKSYLKYHKGVHNISQMIPLPFGEESKLEPKPITISLLKVFQSCPMIDESTVVMQMEHFSGCGRCLEYTRREEIDLRQAKLHPLLSEFIHYSEERQWYWFPRPDLKSMRVLARRSDDAAFEVIINEIGSQLRQAFEEYLEQLDANGSLRRDYEKNRSELSRSKRRSLPEEEGSQPLGQNEDFDTAAARLADSVRILVKGNFYEKKLRQDQHVYRMIQAVGLAPAHAVQAMEFISWLQAHYPNLDLLGNVPAGEIRKLVTRFCEERAYNNVASFTGDVMKWLTGKGERSILNRLIHLSSEIKRDSKTYRAKTSPLERYQTVPFHALFLFLSAGDFPEFVQTYWQDLNYLTGDYLDVYYTFEDAQRKVSAYEVLGELRSLEVQPTLLPALLLWKKTLSEGCVIPLGRLSHADIFSITQLIIEEIRKDKELEDICEVTRARVQAILENSSPGTKIFVQGGITMGDTIKADNITNYGGVQNIGKFRDVTTNLNTSGQKELAEVLTGLREAVLSSQHLSDDKKQEQAEIISQIGEQAAKPAPNKTMLKMLGDGLMSTLKAIPDVAKSAGALAPLLEKLVS